MPAELQATVSAALSIFDEAIPMEERVKFVLADESRLKMAHDWSPKLPIGGLVVFFEKDPDLAACFCDWESFREACKLLIGATGETLPNVHPILKATMSYIVGIDSIQLGSDGGEKNAWKTLLTRSAVALRCAVPGWADTAATGACDVKESVPKQLRAKVVKLTEKYMGSAKSSCEWLEQMKVEVEADVPRLQERHGPH